MGEDIGTVLAGIDMWMRTLKIGLPISMKHHRDHEMLERADLHTPIAYPKPDGVLSFDKLTNVSFSYTNHAEDQPVHPKVLDRELQRESEFEASTAHPTVTAPPGSTSGSSRTASRSSRSTRRTASTARPATSRTRTRTSNGLRPKAAADRTIRICNSSPLGEGDQPQAGGGAPA